MTAAADVVDAFYRAYAVRDLEAMMALLSDDVTEDLSGVGTVAGTGEERAFLAALFAAFPDLTTTVTRRFDHGDVVTVEWRRTGTFSGAEFQGLPATGAPFELRGAALIEVADGRITRITGYYDTAEFARAVGLLPGPDSRAHRFLVRLLRLRTRLRRGRPS